MLASFPCRMGLTLSLIVLMLFIPAIEIYAAPIKSAHSTVLVSGGASSIAVNPSNNIAYVASGSGDGTITIINGTAGKIITSRNFTNSVPLDVAIDSKNDKAYVTDKLSNKIFSIDAMSNSIDIKEIKGGNQLASATVNENNSRLYLVDQSLLKVLVIDTSAVENTMPVIGNISLAKTPCNIGLNQNTGTLYVISCDDNTISIINGTTNKVIGEISVGNIHQAIAVNYANNVVYVTNSENNTISVINGTTNKVIDTIKVGNYPVGIDVNPNTDMIYVVNQGSDTVSVINGTTNKVIDSILVGNTPRDVSINIKNNTIYVANEGDNTVSIINEDLRGNLTQNNKINSSQLTVNAQFLNSIPRYGLITYQANITLLNSTDDAILSQQTPPAKFELQNGREYIVMASDNGNIPFAYWKDNGSTDRERKISIKSDTQITAVYNFELCLSECDFNSTSTR